jgi:hypothetical protein
MTIHRPTFRLAVGFHFAIIAGSAFATTPEQLAGIVSSVDVDGKKIVVTPTGKEQTVDVLVNDQTEITTEAGKTLPLKDLKIGDGLGIAHTSGLATKILVAPKPSELTGHVKSVGANLKTFVVTETGTTIDVTVAIKPETSIVSVQGKKLELKELKKGDGVGISHVNSVASKVLVNVKPADKKSS